MFKAIITEETTTMSGTIVDKLTGLLCYIDALKEIGISEKTIKEVVDLGFKKDLLEKEIFKMFD